MRVPSSLEPLVEMGVIDEVLRPLRSGKEANVYVVSSGGEERIAKVYKDAGVRSFKRRDDYIEGRRVRNSRDRRAMEKRSRHGKERDEEAWRAAEVDVIYRLYNAGVRVPTPYNYINGVLIMELVVGADGLPAPQVGDVTLSPERAQEIYERVLQEVIRMLCAGVVHGDLSDFNILLGADGPVVIDFPQAIDPASNNNARRLLLRDVDNLNRCLGSANRGRKPPYGQEMWALFERNELTPETRLRGRYRDTRKPANTKDVLSLVGEAARDEAKRPGRRGKRRRNAASKPSEARGPKVEVLVRNEGGRTVTRTAGETKAGSRPASSRASATAKDDAATEAKPARKRRRRRRRKSNSSPGSSAPPAK